MKRIFSFLHNYKQFLNIQITNHMDHPVTCEQLEILSAVDFIVPIKQIGLITRAVLEAIYLFYRPRRIIVITAKKEGEILGKIGKYWNLKNLEIVFEEDFFKPNFGLTLEEIINEYDANRKGDQREAGWWIQQLIKLGASTQIDRISPTYIVWDGDLVPTRRWKLCDYNQNGDVEFYVAILQSEAKSVFNSTQYAACMEALTGMTPVEPIGGGTFVSHHMTFNKMRVLELLNLISNTTGCNNLPWPKLIMSYSKKFYRFSEYKTYASFMSRNYPSEFKYHPLPIFGTGGLRFREANQIMDQLVEKCSIINGGIPYDDIKLFFEESWYLLPGADQDIIPAYIQLDHVYGLEGIDLNIESQASTHSANQKGRECNLPSHSPASVMDLFPIETTTTF